MTRAKDISKIVSDADFGGTLDVDGTTNLDVVDIDGAVDMASTLAVTGIATFTDDIIIGDGKTIGSASKVDAITIASSGLTQLRSTGIGAGSPVLQVIDDGTTILNVRAEDGNISFPVAGAGIYLGVTAGASSNLLDDYEEGTWTATQEGSTSNPSTAVTVVGTYTKIGNMCYAQFQHTNLNTTGAAGGVRITGLPFTASGAQATGNVMTYVRYTLLTGSTNISPYMSGTTISFYQSTSNGGWSEIAHNAGTGAYISASVFYKTT